MATSLDILLHASRDTSITRSALSQSIPVDEYVISLSHATLVCKAKYYSEESKRTYDLIILLLNAIPHPESLTTPTVSVPINNSVDARIKQMTLKTSRAQISCSCDDYTFRWALANHQIGSLYGPPPVITRKSTTKRPPLNPQHIPGMCKHLRAMIPSLQSDKILQS